MAEMEKGFERAAPVRGLVQKQSGGLFLARGKIHSLMNAPSMGVGIRLLFVAVRCKRKISKVYTNNKNPDTPSGCPDF